MPAQTLVWSPNFTPCTFMSKENHHAHHVARFPNAHEISLCEALNKVVEGSDIGRMSVLVFDPD